MEFRKFRKIDGLKTAMSQRTVGMKTDERVKSLETAMIELLEVLSTHGVDAHGKSAFKELQGELTGEAPGKKKGVY